MDTWLDYSLREKTERREGTSRREKADSTALVEPEESVGTIWWVGASKSRSGQRDREKEGETRDETWSLKDERGERLENKSWRAPRDLADAASGKSHRSMTEEQEGEKKQSTGFGLPPRDPLRRHLWLGFFEFWFFFSRRQIELIPHPVPAPPRSDPVIYDSKFPK